MCKGLKHNLSDLRLWKTFLLSPMKYALLRSGIVDA
jgi:hypothetical protein